MSYLVPNGDALSFRFFGTAYSAPDGGSLSFQFESVLSTSFSIAGAAALNAASAYKLVASFSIASLTTTYFQSRGWPVEFFGTWEGRTGHEWISAWNTDGPFVAARDADWRGTSDFSPVPVFNKNMVWRASGKSTPAWRSTPQYEAAFSISGSSVLNGKSNIVVRATSFSVKGKAPQSWRGAGIHSSVAEFHAKGFGNIISVASSLERIHQVIGYG